MSEQTTIRRLERELAQAADDLAAATQTVRERRDAVLAIHHPPVTGCTDATCQCREWCEGCDEGYPCATVAAVGGPRVQ